MINSDKIEKYDKSFRIVLYGTNKNGECIPEITAPEIANEMVDIYYQTKSEVWNKLKKELILGNISPIKLFFEYHNMSLKDIASRAGLSVSAVKKHFTIKGFMKINIKTLQRYAVIFDISIGDFFQFLHIKDKRSIDVKGYNNRLIQDITISSKG